MTDILAELKWETLQKRGKDNQLKLLYKGLKGNGRNPTDDLFHLKEQARNQHSIRHPSLVQKPIKIIIWKAQ